MIVFAQVADRAEDVTQDEDDDVKAMLMAVLQGIESGLLTRKVLMRYGALEEQRRMEGR